ncbi:hypothetical protein ACFQV2_19270 [Actinokineospora soli]|uniref:Uncharacterized protein n=1 Tax=Actinokineospora soli TaxID=1048753 RepID=A0ABW2TNF1_9PSEU
MKWWEAPSTRRSPSRVTATRSRVTSVGPSPVTRSRTHHTSPPAGVRSL